MDYLIHFFIFLLGVCFTLLFKNYFPRYVEAKAVNKANNEDIPKLTRAIENIKSELSQQGEFLKAKLSFTNQHRLNLTTAEREAIVMYNRAVAGYLYYLIRFPLHIYTLENYSDMSAGSIEMARLSYEYDIASAHLDLFIQDPLFVSNKTSLILCIYKINHLLDSTLLSLKLAFQEAEIDIQFAKTPNETSLIRNELGKKGSKIQEAYFEELKNVYKEADILYKGISAKIFNRLQEIIKD